MADILFDQQGAPATPAAGKSILFPMLTGLWASKDPTGRVLTLPGTRNANTADVVANAAETYLTGSRLDVPAHLLQVGTVFKWRLFFSKTAAGVATPIWRIRVGTLGTTGDAQICIFTGPAQTAAVDNAFLEVTGILRNVGAAAVIAAGLALQKAAVTAVGLTNTVGGLVLQNTGAAFDSTTPSLIVGLTVNPGTAGVFTHQLVKAEMWGV